MAFRGAPCPSRFNLTRYCLGADPLRPADKPALLVFEGPDSAGPDSADPDRAWSFSELERDVLRLAALFRARGLKRGDRLLLRMENHPEYALAFFGALAGGIVPIPASTQLSVDEVDMFIADAGVAGIAVSPGLPVGRLPSGIIEIAEAEIAAACRDGEPGVYAETTAEDPSFLIYTSGTTSRPKGVLHAHRVAWGRRPMYKGWYDISQDDVVLHAGAFNWTYTLGVGLMDPWANGATAVIHTGPKARDVWPDLIARSGATIFAAVPTVYRQMLKYGDVGHDNLGALRHGLTAGETLPIEVAREWHECTGRTLYEAFGMSELSTYISSSPSVPPRPGSPGKPQAGRDIAVLAADGGTEPLAAGETGVIAAHRSDPGLMLGYWNRPDEEAEVFRGEWFLTGDLGTIDEDGYVWPQGRDDDMMNPMGYRVSPLEVEAALERHPDIAEAAVIEREVRANVRIICAFAVAHTAHHGDAEAVLAFLREHLAAYKVPGELNFVEHLPRTANGKLRRGDLRAQFVPRLAQTR